MWSFKTSGDSYRFTLQPTFPSPRHEFRCHVRRRRPEALYQLWFYVSLPSAGFETPRVRSTVRPPSTTSLSSSSGTGSHQSEFLTVEHVSGVNQLYDEFMLVGRRPSAEGGTPGSWNYSVHPVYSNSGAGNGQSWGEPSSAEAPWRRIASHAISNNIRVLSTQPSTPFGYSTSAWAANDFRCDVDVMTFRPVTRLTTTGGSAGGSGSSASQRVAVDVTTIASPTPSLGVGADGSRRDGSAFEYRLKSTHSSPYVHFFIPGGKLHRK
jgi:hypothetical protein